MPLVKMNMGTNHLRTFMQGGTQSVIYSRKVREQILKSNKEILFRVLFCKKQEHL